MDSSGIMEIIVTILVVIALLSFPTLMIFSAFRKGKKKQYKKPIKPAVSGKRK